MESKICWKRRIIRGKSRRQARENFEIWGHDQDGGHGPSSYRTPPWGGGVSARNKVFKLILVKISVHKHLDHVPWDGLGGRRRRPKLDKFGRKTKELQVFLCVDTQKNVQLLRASRRDWPCFSSIQSTIDPIRSYIDGILMLIDCLSKEQMKCVLFAENSALVDASRKDISLSV